MSKAIAIFAGGVTDLRQMAVRDDGMVFTRAQTKHPSYGFRWSAWRPTGEVLGENARQALAEYTYGFATLHRATPDDACINNRALFNAKGEIRARLP
jgi:hypothetical protein